MSAGSPKQMRSFQAHASAFWKDLAYKSSQKSVGRTAAHSSWCGIVRFGASTTSA